MIPYSTCLSLTYFPQHIKIIFESLQSCCHSTRNLCVNYKNAHFLGRCSSSHLAWGAQRTFVQVRKTLIFPIGSSPHQGAGLVSREGWILVLANVLSSWHTLQETTCKAIHEALGDCYAPCARCWGDCSEESRHDFWPQRTYIQVGPTYIPELSDLFSSNYSAVVSSLDTQLICELPAVDKDRLKIFEVQIQENNL